MLAGSALAGTALAEPLVLDDASLANARLEPGIYPSAPMPEGFAVPPEPDHPPIRLDWSVGLKGSYTASSNGDSFITVLKPAFTATHEGVRTDLNLNGSAELSRANDGSLGVRSGNLDLTATTLLDRDTTVTGTARLGLSQELPGTPGLNPQVIVPPMVVTGALGGGIERSFGRFNLKADGSLERTVYGPTTRRDTGVTDNGDQAVWEGDTRLRLGLQATPIIEVFGEAELGRDWFDRASTGGVRTDATSRALRAGLAGNWNGIWSASASVGVGQHDFDNAGLTDITTRLYDASLTYSPDETVEVTAGISTRVEPTGSDTTGTARVAQVATADLNYVVNSWLRLRASADWGYSQVEGSTETEQRRGIGAGADYKVNAHTALSADYGYVQRDNSVTGRFDGHTVSLGVTVKR